MRLNYDRKQLMMASKFIMKKNKYAADWGGVDGIARMIYDDMIKLASEVVRGREIGYTSTGGYWIHVGYEDDDALFAEILVDPAVSKDRIGMEVTVNDK